MNIKELLEKQKSYFNTGATLPVAFRMRMLEQLYSAIQADQEKIAQALKADLGKSEHEGFMCETGLVLSEISYMIKHCRRFAKERTVHTPMSQFASRSYLKPTPYGNVLIMSPWNYPFLLTMEPLVDAIAAGNTAIVKPSAYSPATSQVVVDIISACFDPEYVAVVTGGRRENGELLRQKFDLIFFTGSQTVGKEVLRHASEHLTPVILELGGKSPCIVDSTAKLELAAKRIVFGKYLNCGQTCVAPDYILCHESVKDDLVKALCHQIREQFGDRPLEHGDYGKIINEKHFDRLLGLIQQEKVICGGTYDRSTLQIAPTVMDNVTFSDPVMGEEIFGPILPIITYRTTQELYELLSDGPKPLALYLFSQDKRQIRELTARLRYGGGCINDTVVHLATSHMPFGGVGESGMGCYHGKFGFDAFTHHKAILDKKTWIDMAMRYQPYKKSYTKMLKNVLK